MNGRPRSGFLQIARALVLLVYAVVMTYVVILSLAFFLRLFGANPSASFAEWIYRAAARIMEPFRGIFPTQQVTDNSVFDASLLFAVIVYSLFAMLLQAGTIWLSGHIYQREHPQGEWVAEPPSGSGPYQRTYAAPPQPVPDPQGYPAQRGGPSGR